MPTNFKFNVDANVFVPAKFYYQPPPCVIASDVKDFSAQYGQSFITKTYNKRGYLLSGFEEFWTANLRHVGTQTLWVHDKLEHGEVEQTEGFLFTRCRKKAPFDHPVPLLLSDFISSTKTTSTSACAVPSEKKNINKLPAKEHKSDTSLRGNVLDSSKPILHKGKQRQKCDKPTKLKKTIFSEREHKQLLASTDAAASKQEVKDDAALKCKAPKGLRRLSKYCDNTINKETDDLIIKLITQLAIFQDRQHAKDQVKAKYKKRMVYGLRETHKKLVCGLIKFVVFAADIEDIGGEGGLNDLITSTINECVTRDVPHIFGLTRYKMGRVSRKTAPVSCVGILNYQGAEQFAQALVELKRSVQETPEDQSSETITNMINDMSLQR